MSLELDLHIAAECSGWSSIPWANAVVRRQHDMNFRLTSPNYRQHGHTKSSDTLAHWFWSPCLPTCQNSLHGLTWFSANITCLNKDVQSWSSISQVTGGSMHMYVHARVLEPTHNLQLSKEHIRKHTLESHLRLPGSWIISVSESQTPHCKWSDSDGPASPTIYNGAVPNAPDGWNEPDYYGGSGANQSNKISQHKHKPQKHLHMYANVCIYNLYIYFKHLIILKTQSRAAELYFTWAKSNIGLMLNPWIFTLDMRVIIVYTYL